MWTPTLVGSDTIHRRTLMKKFRSMLLSLTIVLALCLAAGPVQVRADPPGGPQNTSNSQSSGGSSLTLAEIAALIAAGLRLW